MRQYLELLRQTLAFGVRQDNRTGIATRMIPGAMMKFDLAHGFPILTTKKMPFKSIVGELLGFLHGFDNAERFRAVGCKVWDANANVNKDWLQNPYRKGPDDLGRIYGVQWRDWGGIPGRGNGFDQLRNLLKQIERNPTSRRMVVSAWNPVEMHLMALPPCHYAFQVLIEQQRRVMHMCMTMRSCDMFLGVPFNITSYALLLSILARATEYEVGTLTMFLSDVHIYENHTDQVQEQLNRVPRPLPLLEWRRYGPKQCEMSPLKWIEALGPSSFDVKGYDPHPAIKGELAA